MTFVSCVSDLSSFEKSGHSRRDNISTFLKWFQENGGKAEQVVIDDFGEQGLGLKAVCDIKVLRTMPSNTEVFFCSL